MDPERIDQLRNPAIYPEQPESVEILQTHLSVVILAGNSAYKFKKAIRLPFADFSTLEKRRFYCEEEVRLNRRLCPAVYEGVVELWSDGVGGLCVGQGAELIDCAVKMGRLPQDRMMDVLLAENAVKRSEIAAIARRVVAFHLDAERGPEVDAWGDPEKLRDFALANFAETRGAFPAELHGALEARTRRDFKRHLNLLRDRAAAGRIVDGHGDLHARNICLVDPPAIYDCIEFNPSFRCVDVATEHAFLFMDLRFRGHSELAKIYLDSVLEESGDQTMTVVLPMLVRYRATVRAKVSAITAGEAEISPNDRIDSEEAARQYLRLAAVSAIEEDGPWWLIFCGLPASGKSSISASLVKASRGAWAVFSSDRIRKELAGINPIDQLPVEFYSPDFSRRTYEELRDRAAAATKSNSVVILDANFRSFEERTLVLDAAREARARLVVLHIETEEATVIERLTLREADPSAESDADRAVYDSLKSDFEPPQDDEADLILRVSGDPNADLSAENILLAVLKHAETKN